MKFGPNFIFNAWKPEGEDKNEYRFTSVPELVEPLELIPVCGPNDDPNHTPSRDRGKRGTEEPKTNHVGIYHHTH